MKKYKEKSICPKILCYCIKSYFEVLQKRNEVQNIIYILNISKESKHRKNMQVSSNFYINSNIKLAQKAFQL